MRIWQTSLILLVLFCVVACDQQKGSFTDARDSKIYKTTKIGEQVWMVENLNYAAKGSRCYDNEPENCEKYGRLYDWLTAMEACPSGWHLPSNEEWDKLYHFVDGTSGTESPYKSETAGKYLKAKEGWDDHEGKSGNGEDKFGFSALPGGYGGNGTFGNIGISGDWWSSSENYGNYVYYRYMYHDNDYAFYGNYGFVEREWESVRCLRD